MTPVPVLADEDFRVGSPCTVKGCMFPEVEAVVREAYRRIGRNVSFTPLPIRRGLHSARSGQTDATLARVCTIPGECGNLVRVPFPLLRTVVAPITTDPDIRVEELEDLAGLKVGCLRGNVVAALLCERAGVVPDRINGIDNAVRMLKAGRIDVYIEDRVMAAVAADELGIGIFVGHPLYSGYFYHWVNSKHSALAEALALAFREMLTEGETERLLGRYVGMRPATEWDD